MAESTDKQQSGSEDRASDSSVRDPRPSGSGGREKFAVSDLIARSTGFLGEPPHVVAGALHGQEDDLTLDAARKRVTDFLERPATESDEEE